MKILKDNKSLLPDIHCSIIQNYLKPQGTSMTWQLHTVKQEETPGYITKILGMLVGEI